MTTSWNALVRRARPMFSMVVVVVSFLACSCSKKGPALYPVHGKVFFEGQPIPGALVILHPVKNPDASMAKPRAVAGPDSSFKIFTQVADDGAPAGEYVVTVVWKKKKLPRQERMKKKGIEKKVEPFPTRFQNPATSGLRVFVLEGPNELPPFHLKK